MPEWLVIVLFVGIPALVPIAGLYLLHRSTGSAGKLVMYRYRKSGQQIAVTKNLLFVVLTSLFAIWWLEYLLPLPLLPILLMYFGLTLVRSPVPRRQVSAKSDALLTELTSMREQLDKANARVQELVADIEASQVELDQAQVVKASLTDEIELKLKEVENWRKLSDDQKKLVISTVGEALRRRTVLGITGVIIGSLSLNLAATLIWELLGAPGRSTLLEWLARWTN